MNAIERELNLWKAGWELIYRTLVLTGLVAFVMFWVGYAWATYIPPKTCTPTLIDRILK
jgi:predicted DNA-binding transcriptional regulator